LPSIISFVFFKASSSVVHIDTPLPAAKPSAFTTIGTPTCFIKLEASLILLKVPKCAVGILFFLHKFYMKVFEPSNWDANLSGPKTLTFFSFKKSTIPSTKGCSGPTTTMSISCFFIIW